MKKLASLFLILLLLLSATACSFTAPASTAGSASAAQSAPAAADTAAKADESAAEEKAVRETEEEAPAAAAAEPAPEPASVSLTAAAPAAAEILPSGDLGDYHVEIHDFTLSKDYNGAPVIIIGYTFTNHSEKNVSAMVALSEAAFQNGVGLDTAIVMEEGVGSEEAMKDVQPDASIDIKEAYLLTSATAPVEYEITELFSWDNAAVGETFAIADGGETVYPAAPVGSVTGELGDFTVSVVSAAQAADYEGKSAVVVTYGFTNNGSRPQMFSAAIHDTLFQNGVELEYAILSGTDMNSMRLVKPGAGIGVTEAYLLTDTSPIDLELEELLSFSSEKLETTINLK